MALCEYPRHIGSSSNVSWIEVEEDLDAVAHSFDCLCGHSGWYLGCGHEVAGFGFRVIWPDADFDGTAERGKPSREPVDSHALHPTTKYLGEGGLVRAATARGLQLCELAPLDGFVNRLNESAFRCELRRFSGGEPDISEDVTAAFVNRDFSHFLSPLRRVHAHV